MQITPFSLFSSAIWISVLILAIYMLRKTRPFKARFSLWVPILLYLFCAARLLVPGEFPFSIVLPDRHIYASVYRFLKAEHTLGGNLKVSLLNLLPLLWLLTAGILLLRHLIRCRRAMASIRSRGQNCGGKEYKIFRAVAKKTGKLPKISLFFLPNIPTPMGAGIFRRYILLPQREYSEKELYYILLHESTHFFNRDILIKLMISVFCCIFWWNPVAYLLKADLEQTLEMKCDASVARYLDTQGKAAYLRTIVEVIKQSSMKRSTPYTSTALFQTGRMLDIKERFDVVMNYGAGHDKAISQIALFLIGACVFVLSYSVIPQPVFDPPASMEPNSIHFDSSNSYVLQDQDGHYWLCIASQDPVKIPDEEAAFYQQTGLLIVRSTK